MRRAFLLIPLLLLAGCASASKFFDPMTADEERGLRASCLSHAWCRAAEGNPLVSYGPQALSYTLSGAPDAPANCQTHADTAASIAAEIQRDVPEAGVGATCNLSGTVPPTSRCPADAVEPDGRCRHAVLGVVYRGEPWIVDNGALRECNRVCRASELHSFKPRLDRSTGEACTAIVSSMEQ